MKQIVKIIINIIKLPLLIIMYILFLPFICIATGSFVFIFFGMNVYKYMLSIDIDDDKIDDVAEIPMNYFDKYADSIDYIAALNIK